MKRHALALSLALASIAAACGPNHNGGGVDANGTSDAGMQCTVDGMTRCDGSTFETCMSGNWNVTSQCPMQCDPQLGCVACEPGTDYCVGEDVHSCTAQGTDGGLVMSCTGTKVCEGGSCVDPCAEAAANRSYIGCEYWAVDLDNAVEVFTTPAEAAIFGGCSGLGVSTVSNVRVCYDPNNTTPDPNTQGLSNKVTAGVCDEPGDVCTTANVNPGDKYTCQTQTVCGLDAQHSPFAIVVSNPQAKAVDVTLSDGTGKTATTSVAAGQVTSLFPQQMGFADESIAWTMQGKKAYKISATAPIVAYQFNPLDNVGVFSNDASLLIPTATFDVKYIALTYGTLERRPDTNDYNSYVTIVAPQDGTMVMVTPSADVRASTTSTQGVITKGTATTFTLNAYDVLNLEAVGGTAMLSDGPDLSGTVIQSLDTKTFGVFAGTQASAIPTPTPPAYTGQTACCADHLEEMMFPTSTWGRTFAIARSQVRLTIAPENDVVRILAQQAGTTVTFNPSPAMGSCGTLGVGQFCEVEISGDTSITANQPILVGHYLKSVEFQDQLSGTTVGTGDPSLAIAVPVEQYRTSYTILIPSQYAANYASISAPSGVTVSLDGSNVTSQLASFAGGAYLGGRVALSAGPHSIQCGTGGCGLMVYGYSDAVSYMFAGGLDLKQIVVN
jgi:hypothetical protein